MASGNTLFDLSPLGSVPTTTNYATLTAIADGSTVVGQVPALVFPGTSPDTVAEWQVQVPSQYAGTTGFTFVVQFTTDGTSVGGVYWEIRVFKLVAADAINTLDLGSKTATLGNVTPSGTASKMLLTSGLTMAKANAGTPVAGDWVRIRVTRDYDGASNTDNAQLLAVYVTET